LSGTGLWLLGIDAAPALGLTAGFLCFVPFVGAILAAVPATLMAITQSPIDAVYTILLFAGAHFIEGNFITPLIQNEAVALPPVISVFSTLIFSILFGPFAVMVAVPITVVGLTALEMLYVEDLLGDTPQSLPAAVSPRRDNRSAAQ
jgi:predicted PurR-regulated permease PerM